MGCSSGWLDDLHENSGSGQNSGSGWQPKVGMPSARYAHIGAQDSVKHAEILRYFQTLRPCTPAWGAWLARGFA